MEVLLASTILVLLAAQLNKTFNSTGGSISSSKKTCLKLNVQLSPLNQSLSPLDTLRDSLTSWSLTWKQVRRNLTFFTVCLGEGHRADHLLEAVLEKEVENGNKEASDLLAIVGELTREQLGDAMEKYKVKAPETKNEISKPFPFNVMFKTSIGPKGDQVAYLRPETAQGIFVNFRDLLYFNGSRLPFAAAQIGQSYRNEISPRAGLIRVREFTQAEIEHFVNPNDKTHSKFDTISSISPLIFSQELQKSEAKKPMKITFKEAVEQGIICNQTLAYFMARTYLFLEKVGIKTEKMRFRQHLENEMAHYAEDCWDCEIETTYGWVECVGLADRSAYDLKAHTKKSGVDLVAQEKFTEPKQIRVVEAKPNKKELGKTFKRDQKPICDHLANLCEESLLQMKQDLETNEKTTVNVDGRCFELTSSMVEIANEDRLVSSQNFTPNVIEPSFGIGRIVYALFEHSFYVREDDEQRSVFGFNPLVAPVKTTVFSLVQKEELNTVANEISQALTSAHISNLVDTGGTTIGRRYARTDEIGVPFAITVDFKVFEDSTITLRERDSTKQVRINKTEIINILRSLIDGEISWNQILEQYHCL
eukprot:g8928.t1